MPRRFIHHCLIVLTILLGGIATTLSAQSEASWDLFKDATFHDVYLEEYSAYASLLNEDADIMALHNTEITIKGYHIPVMEEEMIVLSKFPNANCFFCGGAGLETILEVRLQEAPKKRFEMDEVLTFRGRLIVNSTDWNLVSFILEDAELIAR